MLSKLPSSLSPKASKYIFKSISHEIQFNREQGLVLFSYRLIDLIDPINHRISFLGLYCFFKCLENL